MRQKLLTLVAALSLLLSAASGVLWIRSYWRGDAISYNSIRIDGGEAYGGTHEEMDDRGFQAASCKARLIVWSYDRRCISLAPATPGRSGFALAPGRQPDGWSFVTFAARGPFQPPKPQFNLLGLCVDARLGTDYDGKFLGMPGTKARISSTYLAIPHGMVVISGLAAPAWWWLLRRRRLLCRERLSRGLCVRCGYDLRASGDCCPECGAIAAASLAAA